MAISTVQAIINGVTHTLSLDSANGNYEKAVTAPATTSYHVNSGHYYPVTVKAVDSAGNTTVINDTDSAFGAKLKLRVKEIVLPAIVITSPTDSQITSNALPTVNWTVTDSGAGVNPNTIAITIDNGSKITSGIVKTNITNGYQCSYGISTRLTDGTHTVKVDATDYDDNKATQRAVSFVVDTVPPELSVTSPTNNLVTNNASITVMGTTRDVTSGECVVTVTLNGGSAQNVVVNADNTFSKSITIANGANTIVVTSIDAGGMASSVTRIVTLDTAAPVISNATITPNPVSTGNIFTISVTVTD